MLFILLAVVTVLLTVVALNKREDEDVQAYAYPPVDRKRNLPLVMGIAKIVPSLVLKEGSAIAKKDDGIHYFGYIMYAICAGIRPDIKGTYQSKSRYSNVKLMGMLDDGNNVNSPYGAGGSTGKAKRSQLDLLYEISVGDTAGFPGIEWKDIIDQRIPESEGVMMIKMRGRYGIGSNVLPNLEFIVSSIPEAGDDGSDPLNLGGISNGDPDASVVGANPAFILYELMCNDENGAGISESQINKTSFNEAATTLRLEGFAMNFSKTGSGTIAKDMDAILDTIDGRLVQSRVDLRYELKLMRNDYIKADLVVLNESAYSLISGFSRASSDAASNKIIINHKKLTYESVGGLAVSPFELFEDTSTLNDLPSTTERRQASTLINEPYLLTFENKTTGFTNADLISRVATRAITTMSSRVAGCKVTIHKSLADILAIGDPVILNAAKYKVNSEVFRVVKISYNRKSQSAIVELIEDVLSLEYSTSNGSTTSLAGSSDAYPVPIVEMINYEVPRQQTAGDYVISGLAAIRPQDQAFSFDIKSSDGKTIAGAGGLGFTPAASLGTRIDSSSSVTLIQNSTIWQYIEPGLLMNFGNNIETFNLVSEVMMDQVDISLLSNTYALLVGSSGYEHVRISTVVQGAEGLEISLSRAQFFSTGLEVTRPARIYFINYTGQYTDPKARLSNYDYRLTARTPLGVYDYTQAVPFKSLLYSHALRPMPIKQLTHSGYSARNYIAHRHLNFLFDQYASVASETLYGKLLSRTTDSVTGLPGPMDPDTESLYEVFDRSDMTLIKTVTTMHPGLVSGDSATLGYFTGAEAEAYFGQVFPFVILYRITMFATINGIRTQTARSTELMIEVVSADYQA